MAAKKPVKSKTPTKKTSTNFLAKFKRFGLKLLLWFFGSTILVVFILRFIPVFYTPLMIIRVFEQKSNGKEMICKHDWVPIFGISMNLQKAVVASEDGNFLLHNGFDFSAMYKAFNSNLNGKKLKGGSTITQQTAKNVFLWQGRSYVRKILEAYFTVLIELIWSKERIMEVYLNSIEMGNGIYGAQAASQYWFHKSAKNLTKYEAASVASILPNPLKYKATHSSRYIEKRKNKIIRVMLQVKQLEYK